MTAITLTSLAPDAKVIGARAIRPLEHHRLRSWKPRSAGGLKIVFKDHASGGVRVSWLNEKLLFLSVWRGRIASTDLILDIETSKYVYVEDADDGTPILPCAVKVKMSK